jgi:eukaryotic-like serine/threonine-protein kinase
MVGDLVMDRFRLLERIGAGGVGTVYRGFDERLQRDVAVKEIDTIDSRRVLREAQAAARLNHPGIVTLYEFGTAGGHALLVSELVAGATLTELARSGELTDRDVAEVGADVADALLHAHARGVVHRDLKPQNVIVRAEDGAGVRAKLMDFGIASVAGSPTLTPPGEVLGTLAYMAPEQADGSGAGPEADVYSLALTLYECWAGENPVRRETPALTAREIGAPVPPLRRFRPDLPAALADAVDACLHPEPELRPSPGQFAEALERDMDRLSSQRAVPSPGAEEDRDPGNHRPGGFARRALLACLAPLLGLASAGAAFPAAVAALEPRWPARVVLGLAGWFAYAFTLLWPVADLDLLLGAAAFGLGALVLGWIVRAPHVALALLGALLWAGALTAALRLIAGGSLGEPLVISLSALAAVAIGLRGRTERQGPRTLPGPASALGHGNLPGAAQPARRAA